METIKKQTQRFAGIDSARGMLVVAMIIYHAVYCLVSFAIIAVDLYQGFWWWFPRCIAAGFILISGMSLRAARSNSYTFKQTVKRSVKLALLAGLVSLATFVMFGQRYFVFFGILHLLATASIIAWPLAKPLSNQGLQFARILLGCAVLAVGLWLGTMRFKFTWLAWLGFRPENLYPVDYEPLLPWFAWFIFGIVFYEPFSAFSQQSSDQSYSELHKGATAITSPHTAQSQKSTTVFATWPLAALCWLGRHSLIIYLLHLPVLYGFSWLLSLVLQKL